MASVWSAHDTELRRDVAIKVLFPHLSRHGEVVARFQREARAAAKLSHPNILRVYDVGGGSAEGDGGLATPPYLVMELVRGGSLREVIDRHGALPAELVACIGVSLCAALATAHAQGIVHRDIKPANIMVAEAGRIAITDFGVARVAEEDASLITRTGALLGTPAFMSPEQASGERIDARADLYSLGATLYQLATGSLPYSGGTHQVMAALAQGRPISPLRRQPAMGMELAAVIERLMAPEPADRYASATEAAEALAVIVGVAELREPEVELAEFFADPARSRASLIPRLASRCLARAAAAAAAGKLPQALALADRVLALQPERREALTLVASIGRRTRRRRYAWLAAALCAIGVSSWQLSRRLASDDGEATAGPAVAIAAPASDAAALLYSSPSDSLEPSSFGRGSLQPDRADAAVASASRVAPPTATPPTAPASPKARRRGTPGAALTAPGQDTAPAGPVEPSPQVAPAPSTREPPTGDAEPSPQVAPAPSTREPPTGDAEPPVPAPSAAVRFVITPWCDLHIDGVPQGRVDRARVWRLAPGPHSFVCTQGRGRPQWRHSATLQAGEQRTFRGSVLAPVQVRIAIAGGDAVLLDGNRYANGVELELSPGSHRVTILRGDTPTTSGWLRLSRVSTCTLRDRPALDCY